MTNLGRWVDALPPDSPERQLLAAGISARPPDGAVDHGWQAISVALGTAAATTAVTAKAAAATGAAAKATSATLATTAGAGGLVGSLGAKSVAIGFAVGMGLLGATTVVERITQRDASPTPVTLQSAAPSSPRTASKGRTVAVPAALAEPSMLGTLDNQVPPVPRGVPEPARSAAAPAGLGVPSNDSTSLTNQARELAQVKRLLDAGATGEALRRLEASFISDVHSALSEDRDALYVEALGKSQRGSQAQDLAKRFLVRYPNSPHAEKMRALVTSE